MSKPVRQARGASNSGFSLVELLLTVVFVMLGSQMVQGGLLRAADLFGRYSSTMNMLVWTERQAALVREELLRGEPQASAGGSLSLDGREFEWRRDVRMLSVPNLYAVRFFVTWSESGRPQEYQKEFYAYKRDISQGP